MLVGLHLWAIAQNEAPAIVSLNQLDFSRYPSVDLYVTVLDGKKEPIVLNPDETALFQIDHNDNRVRPINLQSVISLKEKGESELYLALVFDNSESMIGRTQLLETAAIQFIDSLRTGDYACLIDFGDGRKTVKVPEFPAPIFARQKIGFSNSKTFLRKNIPMTVLTSRTFMYDALLYALSSVNTTNVLGRKAIILFSDGEENGSVSPLDASKLYIKNYNIPIYAIDLNIKVNTTLQELALMSGGEYFFVREPKDLGNLYQTILKLLKGQYRLTYQSPEQNILANTYTIRLAMSGRYAAQVSKSFSVDGENIAYYNLVYLESEGKESLRGYLDYVSGFPRSKHVDNVRLKVGNYWHRRGEFAKAMGAYNIILRNPTSVVYSQALLEKADLYKSAKQYAAAQKVYNQVLNTEQNSAIRARAMLELAKAYTAEGNFALALNTYSQLTSQYEGTEMASEAFLEAATLSMEMGDLPAAEKKLEQVIQSYGESKSAVYARMELAKIAERSNRIDDAEKYYREILNSNADPDVKDEASLSLSKIMLSSGNSIGAVSILRDLVSSSSSEVVVSTAQLRLVPALLQAGEIAAARQTFEKLSTELQAQLWREYETVPVNVRGAPATGLVNGAYVTVAKSPAESSPISIIDWPDAVQKFSAVGPVYRLESSSTPSRASLPVRSEWINRKVITPNVSGIFHFANGNWELMTSTYNEREQSYDFSYNRPGVYALLAKPPRIIRLYSIHFDVGKSMIRKEDERSLYEIIDDLKAVPDARLEIGGHTDSTGSEEKNIELSSERANAIKQFMVQNGIDPERLVARGYGSQYPIAPNDSPENMQRNRRTEFTLIRPISDPEGAPLGEKKNYTVFLKAYRSAKGAYEEKRMIQSRGFGVMVMTNEAKLSEKYELTLGIFDSESDAQKAIDEFKREFKGYEPQIIVSRRSQ
ncbi:MAG TPA: OmpA family protein [Bacteroidota bacterium]|nr:OmpA family protein [Bacteroidota bacterium]